MVEGVGEEMTARAFDIMDELPAIFATVTGIDAADVEIGYRDPAGIEQDDLPRVLVYNPTTEEPEAPSYGLRSIEYGYAILVINSVSEDGVTDEATFELCEQMAVALSAAALTNADTAYMNPGSLIQSEDDRRSIVGAFLFAQWEGL